MKWTRRRIVVAASLAVIVAIPTWWLASPLFIVVHGNEAPPEGYENVVAQGMFVDGEPGHHNSGRAILLSKGMSFVLRLENFSVTNGPDIHVFLAKGPRVGAADVDLGGVKVTEGSANYRVPASVDPRAFQYVVIWCVPFSVQFGYAELTFQ